MSRKLVPHFPVLVAVCWLGLMASADAQDRGANPPIPDSGQAASDDPVIETPGEPGVDAIEDNFESDRPRWRRETHDGVFLQLKTHERSNAGAYQGERSERFDFNTGTGSNLFYSYALPHIPLDIDPTASVYIKSNRTGMQLLAQVVLPADLNPDTNAPFVVTVTGTTYEEPDRWARLEVSDLIREVERQIWVFRAKTRKPVRMEGAYLQRLALNLYGGPGETEVFVDSLRVAPVPAEMAAEWKRAPDEELAGEALGPDGGSGDQDPGAKVQLVRNRLTRYDEPTRRQYPWIPSIIYAPGADVSALRRHGFDVYASKLDDDPAALQEAAGAGFLLMPLLGRTPDDPDLSASGEEFGQGSGPDPAELLRRLSSHPIPGSVAFWHLDEGLGRSISLDEREEQLDRIREAISGLRDLQMPGASRLTTAGVAGESELYSRRPGRLDLFGIPTRIWGTATHPLEMVEILRQRQAVTALSNPEALVWTWIPLSAPRDFTRAVWGDEEPPAWGQVEIQPEQIRLMTYAALAGGARALAYTAEADLTGPSGQARLIEAALLNTEIDLLEDVFAQAAGPAKLLKTFPAIDEVYLMPDTKGQRQKVNEPVAYEHIKAAAFETPDRRSALLLVADFAAEAQVLPRQLAKPEIKIIVPGHQSATAWEISLGGVRYLERKRVPGGIELSLKDFGPTSIVLLTSDLALKENLRARVALLQAASVDLAIQQADLQLRSISAVQSGLAMAGHDVPDAARWLGQANEYLQIARAAQARGEYPAAWTEARRVSQPLRLLMMDQYEEAIEGLEDMTLFADETDTPVILRPTSSPSLCSYNTLPQHWEWLRWLQTYPMGPNLVPNGDFEEVDAESFREQGWMSVGYAVDGLATTLENVENKTTTPGAGRRMLKLTVRPADPQAVDELPPFQEHPIVAVQSPPIAVKKHQFLRISARLRTDRETPAGGGGLIVRDSIGGSWLQFRQSKAIPKWSRIVLYRRAPADGDLTVTIGLAATFGDLYIDDLRVERAVSPGAYRAPSPTPEPPSTNIDPIASSNGASLPPPGAPSAPRR